MLLDYSSTAELTETFTQHFNNFLTSVTLKKHIINDNKINFMHMMSDQQVEFGTFDVENFMHLDVISIISRKRRCYVIFLISEI